MKTSTLRRNTYCIVACVVWRRELLSDLGFKYKVSQPLTAKNEKGHLSLFRLHDLVQSISLHSLFHLSVNRSEVKFSIGDEILPTFQIQYTQRDLWVSSTTHWLQRLDAMSVFQNVLCRIFITIVAQLTEDQLMFTFLSPPASLLSVPARHASEDSSWYQKAKDLWNLLEMTPFRHLSLLLITFSYFCCFQFTSTAGQLKNSFCLCRCSPLTLLYYDVCVGQPSYCKIVRCIPRKFGFACCDKTQTPPSSGISLAQARRNLNTINRVAEDAVQTERNLSEQLADILQLCVGDITDLIQADRGEDEIATRSFTQILQNIILKQLERRRANRFLRAIRSESRAVILFALAKVRMFLR